MKKEYEKEYHLKKHDYLYNNQEYYLARARASIKQFFQGIRKNSKILEYGCGLGQNIYGLDNAVGYDISNFALDFCRKKGIKVTNNLNKIDNEGFDIVLCCAVLEHVEEPLKTLKTIYSKLKKGGKLILVLPIDKWDKPNINDVNQHLYCWNFNTITNLLVRAKFIPLRYKIIRGSGFKKSLPFHKISFGFYLFLTKLIAIIIGSKHMKIIAQKK